MKNASINCGCYTFDNIRHAGIYFGVEGIPLPQAITHPAHLPKYLGGTYSPRPAPPPPPLQHALSIYKESLSTKNMSCHIYTSFNDFDSC